MTERKIYFYPHGYLRDRQLDTVLNWQPSQQVLNPEIAHNRRGAQVAKSKSLAKKQSVSWKHRLPLINLKRRPRGIPEDAVVYVWGAIITSGQFIVDLDNPYALTGYNLEAISLYKRVLQHLLTSSRCLEIRCLSQACRETLGLVLGKAVYDRATVHYPRIEPRIQDIPESSTLGCRFLFIGTQFEIKGGAALLRAFRRVYAKEPTASLDIVTHLPSEYEVMTADCHGIHVHAAHFTREEIYSRFMKQSDVLVHPTYVDSFGMVVLEALASGLAVLATDLYALREMVEDGGNGYLLQPPISIWDQYLPSKSYSNYYRDWAGFKSDLASIDTKKFEDDLVKSMLYLAQDLTQLRRFRLSSLKLLDRILKA